VGRRMAFTCGNFRRTQEGGGFLTDSAQAEGERVSEPTNGGI
jgi:hypothetical protein